MELSKIQKIITESATPEAAVAALLAEDLGVGTKVVIMSDGSDASTYAGCQGVVKELKGGFAMVQVGSGTIVPVPANQLYPA